MRSNQQMRSKNRNSSLKNSSLSNSKQKADAKQPADEPAKSKSEQKLAISYYQAIW